MRFLIMVLGFGAAASAIDFRIFPGRGSCTGASIGCANLNPGICCSPIQSTQPGPSGYYAVPRDWQIQLECSTTNADCRDSIKQIVFGSGPYCNTAIRAYAGGYSFLSQRRTRGLDGETGPKKCQDADTIFHEDGQQYDITSIDSTQVSELMALASNGTAPVDFPKAFKALEKSE